MIFLSENSVSAVSDTIITTFLVLLTALSIVGIIVYLCRNVEDDSALKHKAITLCAIFGVGFALRLIFALCIRGYRDDYALFTRMFDNLKANGLDQYYRGDTSVVLYPMVYAVYLIFGGLSNVSGLSQFDIGMQFMIKLPLIASELLTAFAIYKTAGKYFNARIATGLCAFVCACPMFFMGSSVWCSPIVFTIMFACFACYFMARKNYLCTIAFFTAAAFSSKEGIYLFPVACVFAVYHLVRAARKFAKDKPSGKAVLDDNYRAIVTVPVGFVVSMLGAYLIGLFMTAPYNYNPFTYIYDFLIAPFVKWSYFTVNGLSVYSIFNQSGTEPSVRFPSWVFACVFAAIVIAVVSVVYFTKRNRATLVMLAAYSMYTMQMYYPGMTAIGMQISLALLVAAYALVRDKRLLHVLFVTGLMFVINSATVLAANGYLNNLNDFNLSSGDVTQNQTANIVSIVCSVFALIAHLYFTYVTVSVGMTGQKSTLGTANGFTQSVKEYLSVKKKDR